MDNITYLFGAGASYGTLPIVEEIPKRIQKLLDLLSQEEYVLDDKNEYKYNLYLKDKTLRKVQLEMISDLKWMQKESNKHASIDTFAKKLYLKQQWNKLEKLKISMSVFFTFEQIQNKPNPRYDTFFASILNDSVSSFPKNLRILSWNYDSQFEIAYDEYTNQGSLDANNSSLDMYSKYRDKLFSNGSFKIIKLNGTTGFMMNQNRNEDYIIDNIDKEINIENISAIVNQYAYANYSRKVESSLSFAWEGSRNNFFTDVKNDIKGTNVLVVIGYSFPFFNRSIDRDLITSMPDLRKVYFQDKVPENIKERFKAVNNSSKLINLVEYSNLDQFLLPNEL